MCVCVCVSVTVAGFCVARIGSAARKKKKVGPRWRTWEASKRLDAFACERRQEGVFGCARASPWPPNPQAQPSLQGMPQIWLSGSPRGRPSSASRFNMLCVPAPPTPPLHLHHHCPRAGPPLPASRSLLKAPFKPGWCLWIRRAYGAKGGWVGWGGEWRRRGCETRWYRAVILDYVYYTHAGIRTHSRLLRKQHSDSRTPHHTCMHVHAHSHSSLQFFFFFFSSLWKQLSSHLSEEMRKKKKKKKKKKKVGAQVALARGLRGGPVCFPWLWPVGNSNWTWQLVWLTERHWRGKRRRGGKKGENVIKKVDFGAGSGARVCVFFSHILEEEQDRSRLHVGAARPLLCLL